MKQKLFLNSQNIGNYLVEIGLCQGLEKEDFSLELIPGETRNFNLIVNFSQGRKIIVKQERYQKVAVNNEFWYEIKVRDLIKEFTALNFIQAFQSSVLYADEENSIIIFSYLEDYEDLESFYRNSHDFSAEIGLALGIAIANIHRQTFNHKQYRDFLLSNTTLPQREHPLNSLRSLEEIGPEVFGMFPVEGCKFLALYQRYDSLSAAIADLSNAYIPCCLSHNDLKLSNILLHKNWEQQLDSPIIRLIDWERSYWGDPAYDLGILLASYLKLWLNSLVVSRAIKIEQSLKLATIPLEILQPAIATLLQTYLTTFPSIIEYRPDFLQRVVQFTGTALISEILSSIKYQKTFGNTGICMLQVAKSLVCRPEASLSTICGLSVAELTQPLNNKFNVQPALSI